jgi:transposase-like protein
MSKQEQKAVNSPHANIPAPLACPFCGHVKAVRCGVRKTRTAIKQLYQCKGCLRRFSNENPSGCRTPPHVIRRTLSLVCQDYTYDEVVCFIAARLRLRISKSAVSKWVTDFNPPYLAIRKMNAGHKPIIRAHLFTHRGLNYNYQVHQPKLAFCKREGLTRYLNWVPEHIDAALFEEGSRCSQLKLARNPGLYHVTHTPLNRLTADARRLAATNRDRHTAVEDYFIACDRNTIAVETPVVCQIPGVGPIAGHIDILQMNKGRIYILDYKPNASKESPAKVVTQLTLYAAALVQSAGLTWDELRCAYFDEEDYYSFAPSPDLIGLPGPVAPHAAVPPPRAVHPTVHPDGKPLAEKPCTVSTQPPQPRQRWTAPKVFIPRKETSFVNRGGNTR